MRAFTRAAPAAQDTSAPMDANNGNLSSPDGDMDALMQHGQAEAGLEQSEPTLELQAMGGTAAVTGHSAHHLEDQTLDDFAPPPELTAGANTAHGGSQQQAITPFAGGCRQ